MTPFKTLMTAAAAALALGAPMQAEDLPEVHPEGMHIHHIYARTAGGIGASGAVFFIMHNNTATDDRLISLATDVAKMAELHTHTETADGVMQMSRIEGGIPLAAGDMHELARGGDHVMLKGLTRDLKQGDTFAVTLTFQTAGEVVIEATVDNDRKPGAGMDPSGHDMNGAAMTPDTTGMTDTTGRTDKTGMTDPDAITALLKARFDTPETPLTEGLVVAEGDNALASWAQGDRGGRALLARHDGAWSIVLVGGADLRMPEFLARHGVSAADKLSMMFNTAEDRLGAGKVALSSSFEGVVMIGEMAQTN